MKKHVLLLPLLLAASACFPPRIPPERILPETIPEGMLVTLVVTSPETPGRVTVYLVDANTVEVVAQREGKSVDEVLSLLGSPPPPTGQQVQGLAAECKLPNGTPCSTAQNAGDVVVIKGGGGPGPTGDWWKQHRQYIQQFARVQVANQRPIITRAQVGQAPQQAPTHR